MRNDEKPGSNLDGGRRRVLHVAPQFPYFGGRKVIGGYASALLNLAVAQSQHDDVRIIAHMADARLRSVDGTTVELQNCGSYKVHRGAASAVWFIAAAVVRVWRQRGWPHIVHVHSGYSEYLLLSFLLTSVARVPVIHSLYCPVPVRRGAWGRIIGAGERLASRRLSAIAGMSENVLQSISSLGKSPKMLLPPAVDSERLLRDVASRELTLRRKLDLEPAWPTLLFVGNTSPTKNLERTLEAFAAVRDVEPNARLIVTTELESSSPSIERAGILAKIEQLDLSEAVLQQGIVDDMAALMSIADVVVTPFLSSHGPSDYFVAALEAMALGRPVVTANVGGMSEVVTPDLGILVDPTDARQIAEALLKAAGTVVSESAAEEVRTRFSPNEIAKAAAEAYSRAMAYATLGDDGSTRAFYSDDASTYDRSRWESPGGRATKEVQARLLIELVSSWPLDRLVLEVGAGTGRISSVLVGEGRKLLLCDIAQGMLERARSAVETVAAPEEPALVVGSATDLPVRGASIDHIVCVNVLNHVQSLGDALHSFSHALAEDGELIFNYANKRSVYWPAAAWVNRRGRAFGQPVYSRWDVRASIQSLLRDTGLEVVEERGHFHAPRAVDRYVGARVVHLANRLMSRGMLSRVAPFHFVRCRKTAVVSYQPRP